MQPAAPAESALDPRPLSNSGATNRKTGSLFHISTITPAPLTSLPSGVIPEAVLEIERLRMAMCAVGSDTMKVIERLLLSNVALCKQNMVVAGDVLKVNALQIGMIILQRFVVIDFPIAHRAAGVVEHGQLLWGLRRAGGEEQLQRGREGVPNQGDVSLNHWRPINSKHRCQMKAK